MSSAHVSTCDQIEVVLAGGACAVTDTPAFSSRSSSAEPACAGMTVV
ncbi:hypothetical protein [Nocardia albiluteola]|nr:hypothetical protein [Nocardia albiluteola]